MRTIQEKAEAYDKAIEIAKSKIKNDKDHILYEDDIIEIFPELKADEDEITKRMLDVITYKMSQHQPDIFTSEENEWFNAWLEKQREQKPFDYENANIQQKDFAPKVEPKFQVGDWIVNNQTSIIYLVISIRDDDYCLWPLDADIEGFLRIVDVDSEYHLWTIQDAKDGDILACNEEILMFKSYSVQNRISLYCWYNGQTNNFHSKEVVDISLTKRNKIYPATKEKRETLFKAMAEAGYTFDFDKKELKKIERNTVDNVETKFKAGDWIVWNDKCYKVNYNGCGYELFDQNGLSTACAYKTIEDNAHLWTIEDAKDGDVLFSPIHNLLWIFKDKVAYHASINLNYDNNISFDADIVIPCDVCPATKEQRGQLEKAMAEAGYTFDFDKKELKKIEQKPAWSEEDENNTGQLHRLIVEKAYSEYDIDTDNGTIYGKWSKLDNWLKSLKERYTWKPSDEQLKALDIAIRCGIQLGTWEENALRSLNEKLRKLKEE
jgi:outer membrane protein OmpA-like peptidoglycan-associated protein